jgi:2-hydroxy-4-carboxymuconate semialdehyde hemiacetal dehydrogenase
MKIALAGQGAFGTRHLEAIQNIPEIEVISLTGGRPASTEEFAKKWRIPHWTTDLTETLRQPGLEAVIIASPTQVHAQQAEQCMRAGKHVLIEIPISDSAEDAERLVQVQKETGVVAMAGHVRRFNPSHQWVHKRIVAGELTIQQMDVQTYFFRRTNMNAAGQPRTWTDHLLWHHACHTVDLFQFQTGEAPDIEYAMQGPVHPELGIAMDMSIQLHVPSGAILTLSLSFNNDGPFGSFFRYICDNGTYKALYDDLTDGFDKPIDVSNVDVSMNGIELEDREFLAAIQENRQPKSSVADVLPSMQTLGRLEAQLERQSGTKAKPGIATSKAS